MHLPSVFNHVLVICCQAGEAIMQIYNQEDMGVTSKQDNSPLTKADMAAHNVIVAGLKVLTPDIPVLSEESAAISWETREKWQRYWLVDPLDGTKEFIKRNGEFTVNIALIENGEPVLGAVYVPVQDILYCGMRDGGAWKIQAGQQERITATKLRADQTSLRVVASRSHRGEVLEAWLAKIQQRYSELELVSMGSSLKICLVAEGKADVYPRLAPTCEWDTAAAQAVLEAAGGVLVDEAGARYRYKQKAELLNPYFFALGDRDFAIA